MAARDRRNIVLISLDDAVAFWHFKTRFGIALETPNLDRICAQSTAFHAAYCQAPICSPSRASFMSGLSPHQTGVTAQDPKYFDKIAPQQMWPYSLRKSGYHCSSIGKVMQGYSPLPLPIHDVIYNDKPRKIFLEKRRRTFEGRKPKDDVKRISYGGYRGGEATVHEKDDRIFFDHQVADFAIKFFEGYKKEKPFYREVGLAGSHGPWSTPRRFKDMYDERAVQMPAEWEGGFDPCPVMDEEAKPNINLTRHMQWKKSVRNYFSGLTHTDHHLGRVWDAIKASKHAENTIIIIVSDHGLHLGERARFRKHTLWEQVANVPMIIHDPAAPVPRVVTDPVALLDLGPTVMELAGAPPLEGRLGRSLVPYLSGGSLPARPIPTFVRQNAAIRLGRYRFIRYRDGQTQLFDLQEDWWNTRDLGTSHPEHGPMMDALRGCSLEHGFDVDAVGAEVVHGG